MRQFIAILALFLMVAGCETTPTGEKFTKLETAPKGKALVYVYRPQDAWSSGWPIRINGVEAADLSPLGYFSMLLDPGRYSVDRYYRIFSSGSNVFSMDVKAGQVYFVEFKAGDINENKGGEFRVVNDATALDRLKNMRKENRLSMKAPVVPEVATQVTFSKLNSAHKENKVAFENAYRNKLIQVDGILAQVENPKKTEYHVILKSLEHVSSGFGATCYSEDKAQFEQLKTGQKLTITGHLDVTYIIDGVFSILDCVIN